MFALAIAFLLVSYKDTSIATEERSLSIVLGPRKYKPQYGKVWMKAVRMGDKNGRRNMVHIPALSHEN